MGKIIYNKGFKDLIAKQTVAPTINVMDVTFDSITVTFTNNSSQEATISYGLSSPPNDDTVLLAAGATSNNVVISGLDPETTYTIFASANGTPENLTESEIVSTDPIKTLNPFAIFTDTSGSPGATTPINDLDGNIMADLDKGIAYYGTVSHTDLYTSDQLASEVGLTQGTSINNESVWHKYYWNGGIHFWRLQARHTVSWASLESAGLVYGTGTTTSRKGFNGVGSNVQDVEVTKNGLTYIVRNMEGSSANETTINNVLNRGSEFNLILMNLHVATNTGEYVGGTTFGTTTTNGITFNNWQEVNNYSNDDFVGWKTNLGDNFYTVGLGSFKWQQEQDSANNLNRLQRGADSYLSSSSVDRDQFLGNTFGWAPVLTVKHPSFATYGKTGGFNQNEPDF